MSIEQHVSLALRKERLLERIASQRSQIEACAEPFKKPLAVADKLVEAGRFVKSQPWIAGVGVFATVVLLRHNLFRWIGRGWALWRGWQAALRWLDETGYLKK